MAVQRIMDKLDFSFVIAEGMIAEGGEDSFCCSCLPAGDSAMIGAFDGCGGAGSQSYKSLSGKTGAYIGSRIVSGAVYDWFQEQYIAAGGDTERMAAGICDRIDRGLKTCKPYLKGDSRLAGSIVRAAPTTASICIAQNSSQGMILHLIWAGDSRVYLLDEDGLAQLTEDDVEGQDAFSNLSNDGRLTNVIDANSQYELHTRRIAITKPTLVFASTDGCFGYVPSPMQFEDLLLQEILMASSVEGLEEGLRNTFSENASDDFTFVCMGFYFDSFLNLQDMAAQRSDVLNREYIDQIPPESDMDVLQQLWEKYRYTYCRFLQ